MFHIGTKGEKRKEELNALNKKAFRSIRTSIKVLHILAPRCYNQGVILTK